MCREDLFGYSVQFNSRRNIARIGPIQYGVVSQLCNASLKMVIDYNLMVSKGADQLLMKAKYDACTRYF